MKGMLIFGLISILVGVAFVSGNSGNDPADDLYDRPYNGLFPYDRRLQYLMDTKRSVAGIKNLIDELQSRLEKRTACAMDGGLSSSCNHKDAVEAGEHHRFLASSFAPGRRKRRSSHQYTDNYNIFK